MLSLDGHARQRRLRDDVDGLLELVHDEAEGPEPRLAKAVDHGSANVVDDVVALERRARSAGPVLLVDHQDGQALLGQKAPAVIPPRPAPTTITSYRSRSMSSPRIRITPYTSCLIAECFLRSRTLPEITSHSGHNSSSHSSLSFSLRAETRGHGQPCHTESDIDDVVLLHLSRSRMHVLARILAHVWTIRMSIVASCDMFLSYDYAWSTAAVNLPGSLHRLGGRHETCTAFRCHIDRPCHPACAAVRAIQRAGAGHRDADHHRPASGQSRR